MSGHRRRQMLEDAHGYPDPYGDMDAVERIHVGHTEPTQGDRFHAGEWMRQANDALHGLRERPELPADPNVRAWIRLYQRCERDAGRRWWYLDDLHPTGSLEQVSGYVDRLVDAFETWRHDCYMEEDDDREMAAERYL